MKSKEFGCRGRGGGAGVSQALPHRYINDICHFFTDEDVSKPMSHRGIKVISFGVIVKKKLGKLSMRYLGLIMVTFNAKIC